MDHTVVVVGGGPAGALAALGLARRGVRVMVVDRGRPRAHAAAEIVAPEACALLRDEGVWPAIPASLLTPCTKMAVAWDGPAPAWSSFTEPSPNHTESGTAAPASAAVAASAAWHIDRIGFDSWLLDHIRAAGVHVEIGRVERVRRDEAGWRVEFTPGDVDRAGDVRAVRSVASRFAILATGRSPAAWRPAPRERIDNLCLIAGTAEPDPVDPDALIVEAVRNGWWYSAPLVDGRLFVGWMTDFSLVERGCYADAAAASLAAAPIHARRAGQARMDAVIGAASWAMSPAAGPGWMAIGDAALARDPIGGDGFTSAVRSACHASATVLRALGGDDSAWTSAAAHARESADRHRRQRRDLYRRASKRWPAAPFWRRFDA